MNSLINFTHTLVRFLVHFFYLLQSYLHLVFVICKAHYYCSVFLGLYCIHFSLLLVQGLGFDSSFDFPIAHRHRGASLFLSGVFEQC